MSKFFITTPIYYVNDVPHIGHAYTTIACNVLARWYRGHDQEVFFLTGTDEHGTKIAQAAAAHNKEPQAYCDEISGKFQEAWKELKITQDAFIRTTSPEHLRAVQTFLKALWDKGVIFQARYQGKYCVQCERFYAEDELIGGLCPDHRTPPETQSEDNYFFRLSEYKDELLAAITDENHPNHFKIFPKERRNEVIGKLKGEVKDVSISRATLTWGIPLPWDRSQTTYVWVDALVNYLTAIGYPEDAARVNQWWPADLHLMAKDILWFHAIIWPALLIAAGIKVPKKIYAHGFFTVNGQKMSKSLGNVVRPADMVKEYGVDGTRYLLLSAFPFGQDGDFSIETVKIAYNAALANDLGNLISRAMTMAEKYCDSKVPEGQGRDLVDLVLKDLSAVDNFLEHLQFKEALGAIFAGVDRVNLYIEGKAPWKLFKTAPQEVGPVMRQVLISLKALTFYLRPFMPDTAQTLWIQLGQPDYIRSRAVEFFENPSSVDLPAGQPIQKRCSSFSPQIMFVDTHLHVADAKFDLDREMVIERATQAGVTTLIEIAESPDTWETAVRLADQYPFVYASLGIHPHHAHEAGLERWTSLSTTLREFLKHPKVVAIGEFGLDYFRMQNTKEQQDYLFRQQLDLAQELGKPIVIHCRDAQADTQKTLKEYYPNTSYARNCSQPKGVIHCFSGTWEDAQTYLFHGFMLGVDGPVTYPNSKQLKENMVRLPLERIVLETDSPYLPPQSHRGQRNEPAHIPAIAEMIGSLKYKTTEEIARQTTLNAKALFRLDPPLTTAGDDGL